MDLLWRVARVHRGRPKVTCPPVCRVSHAAYRSLHPPHTLHRHHGIRRPSRSQSRFLSGRSSPCAGWNFKLDLRRTDIGRARAGGADRARAWHRRRLPRNAVRRPAAAARRPTQPAPMQRQYEPAPGYDTQVAHPAVSPRFMKQEVDYDGKEKPGTIIINTRERLLYLVQDDGRAMRYGIGVGKPGFTWAGVHHVTQQARMAGLDAARRNAQAPPRSAAPHGRRPRQSARRARHVSRLDALSHPRLERALDHRAGGVVGLHPHAQRGRRSTSTGRVKVGTKVVVI